LGVAEVASSPLGKRPLPHGIVTLWDVASREQRGALDQWSRLASSVAFARDGRMFAADGQGSDISLWDPSIVSVRVRLSPDEPPSAIAFSPSGHTLASTDTSGAIRIWDLSAVPPP
jgi:WD40 repeat protein